MSGTFNRQRQIEVQPLQRETSRREIEPYVRDILLGDDPSNLYFKFTELIHNSYLFTWYLGYIKDVGETDDGKGGRNNEDQSV